MGGGKIDVYLDVVSPYSLFAFKHILEQRPLLESHGVKIEFFPFFLGGVNVATGNKPPGELPAKAKYSWYDRRRGSKLYGVKFIDTPESFPILSIMPQRVMLHLQATQPASVFESAWLCLWDALWERGEDVSKPEVVSSALSRLGLSRAEIEGALAATKDPAVKAKLEHNTRRAVELGAFGSPFFSVARADRPDKPEPFFGSDRWGYMWDFLGLPVQPLRLLPPGGSGAGGGVGAKL